MLLLVLRQTHAYKSHLPSVQQLLLLRRTVILLHSRFADRLFASFFLVDTEVDKNNNKSSRINVLLGKLEHIHSVSSSSQWQKFPWYNHYARAQSLKTREHGWREGMSFERFMGELTELYSDEDSLWNVRCDGDKKKAAVVRISVQLEGTPIGK